MTAFPVMNPAAPLQRKQALLQKLMGQYAQRGVGGASGVGGQPIRGGALTKLGITGGSGMSSSVLQRMGIFPHALGGEQSGFPGAAVEQGQFSQIPGIIQQMQGMTQGQGTPGGMPSGPGMPGNGGAAIAPGGNGAAMGTPGVTQAAPTIPGTSVVDAGQQPGAVDPYSSWVPNGMSNLGGGSVFDPSSGKVIPGMLGMGDAARNIMPPRGSSQIFFS